MRTHSIPLSHTHARTLTLKHCDIEPEKMDVALHMLWKLSNKTFWNIWAISSLKDTRRNISKFIHIFRFCMRVLGIRSVEFLIYALQKNMKQTQIDRSNVYTLCVCGFHWTLFSSVDCSTQSSLKFTLRPSPTFHMQILIDFSIFLCAQQSPFPKSEYQNSANIHFGTQSKYVQFTFYLQLKCAKFTLL